MMRLSPVAMLLLCVLPAAAALNLTFSGEKHDYIRETPDKNTGLDYIYVFRDFGGVNASVNYTSAPPRWYKYANLGGGFAEEITSGVENSGGVSTLTDIQPDLGYIIDFGDTRSYFYIVDYSKHPLTLAGIRPASEQDCSSTLLEVEGEGTPLNYFTINGQQRSLDRGLILNYETEEWDERSSSFVKREMKKELPNFQETIMLMPPVYCATYFTLTGDKYLKAWRMQQSVESAVLNPVAVDIRATAARADGDDDSDTDNPSEEEEKDASNEIGGRGEGLGGSAPAEIQFRAFCTEGVLHNEWQMATDADFENITYRITERDLDYVFREEGTVYVRFVGSNFDGSCEAFSDVFTVNIGASELRCPNAFSPGASEGVNDKWKVSYKSLIDFKCWIFDRYGTQMFYFDDPREGWDGRYKGKLVKPGVYYYVIQATGSEGKKYKKSGDINIIRYKNYSTPGGGTGTTE